MAYKIFNFPIVVTSCLHFYLKLLLNTKSKIQDSKIITIINNEQLKLLKNI